jgi:hypothetical protein
MPVKNRPEITIAQHLLGSAPSPPSRAELRWWETGTLVRRGLPRRAYEALPSSSRLSTIFPSPCPIADGRPIGPPLPAALVGREIDACFNVRDANGQALAYVYFEEEPERVSGIACWGGELASALTGGCVGAVVLSSNARAKTHARLTRKAKVRADPT